mmetsp:Transcript_47341/g.143362  ORF Transcript_47341/g.143362 Transcript_47341/m.143362 type:complete len:196 (-) Transcript_47341:814-1401(-)
MSRYSAFAVIFAAAVASCHLQAADAFAPASLRQTARPSSGAPRELIRLDMNKGKKKKSGGKKSGGGGGGKGFGAALKSLQQNAFNYAGSITPGKQSPQRVVDGESLGIAIPDYAGDGIPKNSSPMLPWVIEVKTPEEIVKMRAAGRVAREVLDIAGRAVKVGITTDEIDALVHEESLKVRLLKASVLFGNTATEA